MATTQGVDVLKPKFPTTPQGGERGKSQFSRPKSTSRTVVWGMEPLGGGCGHAMIICGDYMGIVTRSHSPSLPSAPVGNMMFKGFPLVPASVCLGQGLRKHRY